MFILISSLEKLLKKQKEKILIFSLQNFGIQNWDEVMWRMRRKRVIIPKDKYNVKIVETEFHIKTEENIF